MKFCTTKDLAERWNISERRIRKLCEDGKIKDSIKIGKQWLIPDDSMKPLDGRYKTSLFEQIKIKKTILDYLRPLTEGELKRLNNEFVTEYTYNSNAIEGSSLTLRETDLVFQGITIDKKPLKDHFSAIGHKEAFEFILEHVKSDINLSISFIKQIHSLVLMDQKEDKGVFRKVPVYILGAKHKTASPNEIEPKLEELIELYLNCKEENIFKKIAEFHIRFEEIHPFIDGNGRTGRLIINFELIKNGYPPIDIKYTDRTKYYSCFDYYYENRKNSILMEDLIERYVLEKIDKYIKIIKN